MIPRFASVLLTGFAASALWAQAPTKVQAPAEVEQALRARVNEFFQYHVERGPALRKAMDIVAEETKDEYYAAGKMEIKKFVITEIQFEEGVEKADVTLDVTRPAQFGTFAEEITLPMYTKWKIEEGKWVWYKDKSVVALTPMGVSDMSAANNAPALPGTEGINLADLGDPKKLMQHAAAIMGKSGLDRTQIFFKREAAGEDTLVYSNNYLGSVILDVYDTIDLPPGLTVELDKKALAPNEVAKLTVRYTPPAKDPNAAAPEEGQRVTPITKSVRLAVQPFNREIPVNIHFDRVEE